MPASPTDSIGTTLNLAKALALARSGRMKAAQAVLTVSGGAPDDPIELHALAALVTSAGDLPRALILWRQLLQRDPRHAEARRMISAIELWQVRPAWYGFIPVGAASLGVVLLVIVLLYASS
jgi:hypothetical protein